MSRFRRIWLPLGITLLALGVRLGNLTYHSLWFDEAMSVHWARSSIPRILQVSMNLVEDRLPPLYYLSLHTWRLFVGDGEMAVRLPSVLLGTLLVPVVYRLAADLFDRRLGSLAAALTALNPFLVWYSQEARMYALAVLLAALGTWFFLVGAQRRRAPTYWLAYGLCALAGLYTHLYTGLLLPAHALYLLLTHRRSRRAWLPFALTILLVAGLFVPLGLATWRISGEAGPGDPLTGFWARAWWLLSAFTVWKAPLSPHLSTAITIGIAGFAIVGLFAPFPPPRQSPPPSHPLSAIGHPPSAIRHQPPATSHPPSATSHPPPAIRHQPSATSHPPSAIRHPPSAISSQPGARPPRPMLFIALLFLTPFAIANLLLFRNQVAFFGERYFIVIVPWLLIAAAAGAVRLARRLSSMISSLYAPLPATRHPSPITHRRLHAPRSTLPTPRSPLHAPRSTLHAIRSLLPAVCCLLPLAFTLIPLPGQWSLPARKEAWRETAGYFATYAHPEDAILIHPDWTRFPLQYYFQGPGQTYAVFGSVDDSTDLDGPLSAISSAHPVVWLVESHTELADPDHRANAWLADRYPEVTEFYPPGLVAVRAYAPGYLTDHLPHDATPLSLDFEGGLVLAGYTVPQTRMRATDDLFHPPSGWAHVTLYWTAEESPTQAYTPFVHLIDNLGQVWGASLERPNDAFDFYPPPRWEPGQVVRADFDVNLNPATPPGRYTLVVGLRDASRTQVLLADGSLQAPLAGVEVVK